MNFKESINNLKEKGNLELAQSLEKLPEAINILKNIINNKPTQYSTFLYGAIENLLEISEDIEIE